MSEIAIIDYKLGNIQSVLNAFKYLHADAIVTNKWRDIKAAKAIVLPGVGSFTEGMYNLEKLELVEMLNYFVVEQRRPVLGICLGMQLMADKGYENGICDGLKWIKGEVIKFNIDSDFKIPHVGWNDVNVISDGWYFQKTEEVFSYYFIHSYHFVCNNKSDILGICNYGIDFAAIISKENILGTQFHPEKSQKHGLLLLKKFIELVDKKV